MPAVKPLIAIAAAAATAVVGGVVGVSLLGPQMATVKSVTDGDTIVVTLDTGGAKSVSASSMSTPRSSMVSNPRPASAKRRRSSRSPYSPPAPESN